MQRIVLVGLALLLVSAQSPSPKSVVIWQAGNSTLGQWEKAVDGQCGVPMRQGTSFSFALTQDKVNHSCARNMANLLNSRGDDLLFLSDGKQYTFTFRFIDKGMTDGDARALIWQIHGHPEPHTPCTSLNLYNSGDVGTTQRWALGTCDANGRSLMGEDTPVWTGAYTPGERDDWKIVVVASNTARGSVTLYRNNEFQGTWNNIVTYHGDNPPWVGIGIYKWIWGAPNRSTTTQLNMIIDNMTVTAP